MKRNYPDSQTLKKSADRVADLLRNAAQPIEPDFASNIKGYMNTRLAGFLGKDPSGVYDKTIEADRQKVIGQRGRELQAESGIYDMLVKQRDSGDRDAEKILDVAGKLSNNDPEQMSRLIQEGYKRYPDGDMTLTDAVNLAGELGIKPKKSDEQMLKEQYLRAKIGTVQGQQGQGLTPAMQNTILKNDLKQTEDVKTRVDSAQALLSKISSISDLVDKTGSNQGPYYSIPYLGKTSRARDALFGEQSERDRRQLEAGINQLQGLMSSMRKGQGAVSDYERSLYEKMGPQITNDKETNISILNDLAKEAQETIRKYGANGMEDVSTGDSIDSTIGNQSGKSLLPIIDKNRPISEQITNQNPELDNLKNKYGLD